MSKKIQRFNSRKSLIRTFLAICLSLFVFGVIVTFTEPSQSQNKDLTSFDYQQIAKSKTYAGALDEEELKVQKEIMTSEALKKKLKESVSDSNGEN